MAKEKTWYEKGYDEAVSGVNCDPPYVPGNKSHDLYMSGYHDGTRYVEDEEYRTGSRAYSGF
jgi:hypothetical protein